MQNQEIQYSSSNEEHKLQSDGLLFEMPNNKFESSPTENGIKKLQMNDESNRLSTFISWPNEDIIASYKLAKAGFYYYKNGDEVQCFSCGGKIKDWQSGDIAVRKHRELFPKCNFIAEIFSKATKKCNIGSNNSSLPVSQNNLASSETFNRSTNSQATYNSGKNTSTVNQALNARNYKDIIRTPDFEKLKLESERLKTFNLWPLENPKSNDLAREGFFYLLETDKVQCAFCRGIVSSWERNDDPLAEHARHFPFCPFIMGRDVGNIPINMPGTSSSTTRGIGHDECGSIRWKNSVPENGYKFTRKINKLENFGVKLHDGPRHPAQASKDARMRSFVTWPSTSALKPIELVDAGFFYIGIKDFTRCFYCDGGLCNWEKDDDPWVEHARWFQNCAYVRLNKGDDFVESCLVSSLQKSTSETSMETSNESSHVCRVSANVESQVNECMKSSIVQSALEPGIFPAHLIREVLIKRIENGEGNFKNADELCEIVLNVQEELENNSRHEQNGYDEPMDDKEEMNINVRNSPVPSENSQSTTNVSVQGQSISRSSSIDDLLKEQRLCKICMDKEIGVLFLPCGHLMACVQCAPAMSDCPFCRKPIKGTVRAFLT